MSVGVIENFKMIHVQHDHSQRNFPALGPMDLSIQGFLKIPPVKQTGKGIPYSLISQAFPELQICQR